MRILVLVKHGYGESGGIARYTQDFLNAITLSGNQLNLTVLAQVEKGVDISEVVPSNIRYITVDAQNEVLYLLTSLKLLFREKFDHVFCMHLYLLPVACMFRLLQRSKLLLCIYGIEAWQAKSGLFCFYSKFVDRVVSISSFTLGRFSSWFNLLGKPVSILPPAVNQGVLHKKHLQVKDLRSKYSLEDKLVLLTLGRLHPERDKGHRALIKTLPTLLKTHQNLVYLIAGTGDDQQRLQLLVGDLGLERHVYFAGFVSEEDKPTFYKLADVFFMAGEGEGFGIVYLEALACGCPVIASKLDASAEVLNALNTGILVDPSSEAEVRDAVLKSLQLEKSVPVGLERYSLNNFNKQVSQLLTDLER